MKTSEKYLKILVNFLLLLFGAVLLVYVMPRLIMFFLPLVIGWLIAVLANPLVHFLENHVKIVRKHSSMLIILTAIGLVILVFYLIIARLGGELVGFIYSLPELFKQLEVETAQIGRNLNGFYLRLPESFQVILSSLNEEIGIYMGAIAEEIGKPTVTAAGNLAKNIPSFLMSLLFVILSAYFFIADRERIMKFFRENTPKPILNTARMVINTFKQAVGGYFKAQFKIMGVVFAILLVGFMILGVRYSVLLAFLFSLLDFLPFLGTAITLIPWAIYQFLAQNYSFAIGLVIIYVVSQAVRQMIQPKIVGDTVGMSPTATLIAIFIGYRISGVLGMIVAVPIGVIFTNLYKMGTFQGMIDDLAVVVEDLNEFRKR